MIFLLILLAAIALVILNRSLNKDHKTIERFKNTEITHPQTPVAKEYTILYAYAVASAALVVISIAMYLSTHPWTTYSAQLQAAYQAQHLAYPSMQFIKTETIISTIVGIALSFAPLVYIVLSKKMRNILILLSIFFVLSVLGLVIELFVKSGFNLLIGAIQTGLTAVVLVSLMKKKKTLI